MLSSQCTEIQAGGTEQAADASEPGLRAAPEVGGLSASAWPPAQAALGLGELKVWHRRKEAVY